MEFLIYNKTLGGLGSQLLPKLIGISISYHNPREFIYCHYPWNSIDQKISHNYLDSDGKNDSEFENKLEKYFNFKKIDNIKIISSEDVDKYNYKNEPNQYTEIFSKYNYSYQEYVDKTLTPEFINYYKNIFYSDKKRYVPVNNKKKIVIHIRRGDVYNPNIIKINTSNTWLWNPNKGFYKVTDRNHSLSTDGFPDGNLSRWLPLIFYTSIMQKLDTYLSEYEIEYHIVTESGDNFDEITAKYPNAIFHIDDTIIHCFNLLINCDILVLGRSSLSYCAGLLCDGLVIYNAVANYNNDRPPSCLKNWITI